MYLNKNAKCGGPAEHFNFIKPHDLSAKSIFFLAVADELSLSALGVLTLINHNHAVVGWFCWMHLNARVCGIFLIMLRVRWTRDGGGSNRAYVIVTFSLLYVN